MAGDTGAATGGNVPSVASARRSFGSGFLLLWSRLFWVITSTGQQCPNALLGEWLTLPQDHQPVGEPDIDLIPLRKSGLFPNGFRNHQLPLAGDRCDHEARLCLPL